MIIKTRRVGLSAVITVGLILSGIMLPGCGKAENGQGTPPATGPTVEIPEQAQREIDRLPGQQGEAKLVIILDNNGQFKAYRGNGTKTKQINQVLPANIDQVLGITIFKTTNPKYCWTNTRGQQECIEW